MNLTLDAESEKRIQREIDLGHYSEPSEVIAHALNLLEAEQDWLQRNKEAISEHLDESLAQAQRGETISGDQAREFLAQRRIACTAGATPESATEFFRRQAQNAATVEDALTILDKAPNVPPMLEDEAFGLWNRPRQK